MSMPPTTDVNTDFDKTNEIALNASYQAISVYIKCHFTIFDETGCVDVAVGQVGHRFVNFETWFSSMNNENGNIPM